MFALKSFKEIRLRRIHSGILPFLVFLLFPGCTVVERTAHVPGDTVRMVTGKNQNAEQPADPNKLQQELFRFADEFMGVANDEYARLIQVWTEAPDRQLSESRLEMNYRILEIASGPNAYANLVDMVFTITQSRYYVETFWLPGKPGEISRPTLEKLRVSQKMITDLASESLSEEESARLQANINAWLENNTEEDMDLYSRYPGLLSELLLPKSQTDGNQPTSFFGVLMLDPLAGLDPTVREITQTRLFAERAMYVSQRMPKVLRLEMELFNQRLLATPEVAGMFDDAERLTRSIEQVSAVAAELPDRVKQEREALVETLKDEREGLTELMAETELTLDAASLALENLDTVVNTTDRFLGNLGVYDEPDPNAVAEPSEPFRIQDYTSAAEQLAVTSDHLNQLVLSLDQVLATATSDEVQAKLDAASQTAVERSQEVVHYAFIRAIWFAAIACLFVLGAVTINRKLRARSHES